MYDETMGGGTFAINSPSNVQAKFDEVDAQVKALDSEFRHGGARPEFLEAWQKYIDGWAKVYKEVSGNYLSRFFATGSLGQLDDYKGRLNEWRDAFVKREGGSVSTPALAIDTSAPLLKQTEGPLKILAVIAGLVVVGLVITKMPSLPSFNLHKNKAA